MAKSPCLFLSHSGTDTEAARELKRRILASPTAREAGLRVWFDKDDLEAGTHWQEQLERALTEQATAFAVYVGSRGVSPKSTRRKFASREPSTAGYFCSSAR